MTRNEEFWPCLALLRDALKKTRDPEDPQGWVVLDHLCNTDSHSGGNDFENATKRCAALVQVWRNFRITQTILACQHLLYLLASFWKYLLFCDFLYVRESRRLLRVLLRLSFEFDGLCVYLWNRRLGVSIVQIVLGASWYVLQGWPEIACVCCTQARTLVEWNNSSIGCFK